MNLALVPSDRVAEIWPHVSGLVDAALAESGGGYRPVDVVEALEEGRWLMWLATTPGEVLSMCCTHVAEFPARKFLYVVLAAGKMDAVRVLWPAIRDCARAQGCSAVHFFGRRGWARSGALPEGFRVSREVVTMELDQ